MVAHHRARDLNSEDPYVTVRCGDRPARLERRGEVEVYVRENGRSPVGYRDLAAGCAAGYAYTVALWDSRCWLYDACGIGTG